MYAYVQRRVLKEKNYRRTVLPIVHYLHELYRYWYVVFVVLLDYSQFLLLKARHLTNQTSGRYDIRA
jgi:hypothetical protein